MHLGPCNCPQCSIITEIAAVSFPPLAPPAHLPLSRRTVSWVAQLLSMRKLLTTRLVRRVVAVASINTKALWHLLGLSTVFVIVRCSTATTVLLLCCPVVPATQQCSISTDSVERGCSDCWSVAVCMCHSVCANSLPTAQWLMDAHHPSVYGAHAHWRCAPLSRVLHPPVLPPATAAAAA